MDTPGFKGSEYAYELSGGVPSGSELDSGVEELGQIAPGARATLKDQMIKSGKYYNADGKLLNLRGEPSPEQIIDTYNYVTGVNFNG